MDPHLILERDPAGFGFTADGFTADRNDTNASPARSTLNGSVCTAP
ncbi:hypothetical protein ACFOWZ_16545 [Lentzea rhizosphaerae]|uniref:Uncharacterized protein n=1 Tax=Lentzea rhizosphaerae TaxID=2041025 RepID=A0ABV8BUY3_9PSEU